MPRSTEQPVVGPGAIGTIVILAMGVAISLLVWHALRTKQVDDDDRRTAAYAASVAGALEQRLDDLYRGLRSRWEFWGNLLRSDPELWHQGVTAYLHRDPAVLAVMHSAPSIGRVEIEGSAEGQRILRELVVEVREVESDAPSPDPSRVIGPVHLPDGRHLLVVQLRAPGEAPSGEQSGILAVLDPALVVQSALAHDFDSRALRIETGGVVIHRRGSEVDGDAGARTAEVKPSLGAPWTLRVASTADVADERSALALGAGIVISALLSLVVHVGTLSRRRAGALADANAELTRQIEEARRGESELGRLRDVLEARVSERTAELHETIVDLETFNYSVSHDLRGPLGAISNFAAILAADYGNALDGTGREYLRRISHSAAATASMMDALIAYSRSGSQALSLCRVDVKRLVAEVCAEIEAARPGAGSKLEIGDLPEAWADESMLRAIWSNLLSNACKFVRPGEPPHVEVAGQQSGDELVYRVRDHGVGFDMRYTERLFRVFERLHPSAGYGGHGVGLAIVARLVRRHGGRVWAQSAPGKGATFYFSLALPKENGNSRA